MSDNLRSWGKEKIQFKCPTRLAMWLEEICRITGAEKGRRDGLNQSDVICAALAHLRMTMEKASPLKTKTPFHEGTWLDAVREMHRFELREQLGG